MFILSFLIFGGDKIDLKRYVWNFFFYSFSNKMESGGEAFFFLVSFTFSFLGFGSRFFSFQFDAFYTCNSFFIVLYILSRPFFTFVILFFVFFILPLVFTEVVFVFRLLSVLHLRSGVFFWPVLVAPFSFE